MSKTSAFSTLGNITKATRSKAGELWDYAHSKGYDLTRLWGMGSSGSEHPTGRALDLMITGEGLGKAAGDLLAGYLWKNRKRLGVKWIIWNGHIRSTSPGKSGNWEPYYGESDHSDHVHVFFGTAAYVPPKTSGGGGGGTKPEPKPEPGYKPDQRAIYVDILDEAASRKPKNSDSVYWWQRILNAISFPDGKEIKATGDWTAETTAETKKAQKSIGDTQDGWPGPKQIQYFARKAKKEVGSLSIYRSSKTGGLIRKT